MRDSTVFAYFETFVHFLFAIFPEFSETLDDDIFGTKKILANGKSFHLMQDNKKIIKHLRHVYLKFQIEYIFGTCTMTNATSRLQFEKWLPERGPQNKKKLKHKKLKVK